MSEIGNHFASPLRSFSEQVAIDLFGQVTYEVPEKAAWKLDKLKKFSRDGAGHLLFICRTTEEKKQGDILILSLQKIFVRFIQTDQGRDWLRASL